MSEKILIFGEVAEGKVTTVTKEILTIGRELANQTGEPLSVLLIGENIEGAAKDAVSMGGDNVYIANGPSIAKAHPDLYLAIVAEACKQLSPSIILFSHTDMGRDLAPRLAARLKASVTMDCIKLSLDENTKALLLSKPVYGGNAVAVWTSKPGTTQIATIRPRSAAPAESDPSRQGKVTPLAVSVGPSSVKGEVLETVVEEVQGIRLEDAKVVIAGGGGIGGVEGFAILEELASLLGGTVGVTRVPCDEGWKPLSMEIGQTGRIVSPNLYIAVGVSGAPQHMTGCSSSKLLVAINRDPDANIFKEADLGVVGDYKKVLPSLIERCRSLKM
ncbi:MAG TPA: electron transfer flavoprotein subunit alpha/FixB family protein [Syntrophorhabdaceae bacterium]|nr:electron transfer flavoprotein subunit alpha/FixB family protein [Syntrophorhabdaceae bacterium]HQM81946.1 electron transfer flavoprotein subunit alpha/FixB family protein [Syntrophorhabdaceae bacterium]